jgi:hypothetical protein
MQAVSTVTADVGPSLLERRARATRIVADALLDILMGADPDADRASFLPLSSRRQRALMSSRPKGARKEI